MKKNNLTILSVAFLVLNIIFSLAYDLYDTFWFDYGLVKQNMGMDSLAQIVPCIFTIITTIITIITTVLLLIGVLKQKKIFFCLYYAVEVFCQLAAAIVNTLLYVEHVSMHTYIPKIIFSSLSNITFNVFMFIFILIVFSWKEKAECVTYDANKHMENNTELNTDILIEYKQLLDSGAVTQEEFDIKKSELLNL